MGNGKGVIYLATNTKKKTTASSLAKSLGSSNTTVGSNKSTTTNSNKSTTSVTTSILGAVTQALTSAINKASSGNSPTSTSSNNSSGSSSTNNQYTNYTPKGTYNDTVLSPYAKKQIEQYQAQYNDAKARGDEAGKKAAHDAAEAIRAKYGYSGGGDGSEYIALPETEPVYEYYEERPTYESKYDPQMEALLNEILNREDFSYDAASDPLYQQYAQMYQREGDRATSNALAEAAASAGGMNSYAITAAQQAGNYYSSQLNDKIPELYQLAYDMYLADKESKVQDLGLLQSMDDTQYNRYRNTMSDWQNDRNFAYNMYRDDVSDSQWQQNFDYTKYIDDRDFAYNSEWANKQWDYQLGRDEVNDQRYDTEWEYQVGRDQVNDQRYDTEWDYQVGRDEINDQRYDTEWDYQVDQDTLANSRYDNEWNYKVTQDALGTVRGDQTTAKDDVWKYISMGVVPSDDLIAKAGMSKTDVALAVAAVKAEQGGKTNSNGTIKSDAPTVKETEPEDGGNGGGREVSADGLGIGPVSYITLANLVNEGKVIATLGEDGSLKYKWADGYNKDNYNK